LSGVYQVSTTDGSSPQFTVELPHDSKVSYAKVLRKIERKLGYTPVIGVVVRGGGRWLTA
jgi:hypothetical protein